MRTRCGGLLDDDDVEVIGFYVDFLPTDSISIRRASFLCYYVPIHIQIMYIICICIGYCDFGNSFGNLINKKVLLETLPSSSHVYYFSSDRFNRHDVMMSTCDHNIQPIIENQKQKQK